MGISLERPLTRTELARALGCSRVTLWRYEKAGALPAPDRINGQRVEFSPAAQMTAADLIAGARA